MTVPNDVRVVQRRLPGRYDPFALYAALAGEAGGRDNMVFERSEGPSLVLDRAALRIECHGQAVTIDALSANGRAALRHVADRLAGHVESDLPDRLALRFSRSTSDDPAVRLVAASPFDVLRVLREMAPSDADDRFAVALLGVIGFDHVAMFEDLPDYADDTLDFPDYLFWLAESLVVVDPGGGTRVLATSFGGADAAQVELGRNDAVDRLSALADTCIAAPPVAQARAFESAPAAQVTPESVDLDDAAYRAVVARIKRHIAAGDIYQAVPSRTFRVPCADALARYAALRRFDPSPYRFYVAAPDHIVFGASPETSVRVFREDGDAMVEVKPIAGTRPRGANADEDGRFEADLRLDAKECAEHMMLVDLARNDVARVSDPGTRHVAALMRVERYARVMHLVSSVVGRLRGQYDAIHALIACLNVGTLSGAPKLRATQLLRSVEATRRGPYGGAIGWIAGDGTMDTGVVIRTAVVRDGIAYVRAGAGVVHDSDPQAEADETRRKASALIGILTGAVS